MNRYADRLLSTLFSYVGDLGVQPQEIILDKLTFLNTAYECRVQQRDQKFQFFMNPLEVVSLTLMDAADPAVELPEIRSVQVGDSFVIQGPAGPCTIRIGK